VPEDELVGSRYEVLRTVSEGRRASVLQALDRVHDRLVALKVYPVTDDDRDELLAEARLLMSIEPHPGLPVVRGDFFTQDDDRYVVVMNWVDGTDLQQVLEDQGGPGLPLEDVIDDLAQVATALDHLHGHEPPIVHGDVKPANIVRASNGRVVLVDFDIAGAHAGRGRVGTVGYVAPEVAAGEKPGPTADIFGLGATAVTLLNGHAPTDAPPTYPGVHPDQQGQLARVLRAALSVDPARRPRSASRLVENLRGSAHTERPQGVIALLATEVADAARLWADDPDEMQVAMRRLRDVRDEVVEQRSGRVITAMNEGDHTIIVFRDPSAAALAALDLHDRLHREPFPPGVDVRLQAAIAVGEASLVDGVYTGAVVDKVLRLRSTAEPGATITSESTAELLIGHVGRDVSIVPLGKVVTAALPHGASIFGLTRPGAEHTSAIQSSTEDRPARLVSPGPTAPALPDPPGGTVILDALQHPSTLVALTVVGFALIFLLVLSPEVGMAGLSAVALGLGTVACIGCFGWHYSRGHAEQQARIDVERSQREAALRALEVARDRADTRRRLEQGFARITSDDGDEACGVLAGLGDEFDAIATLLQRSADRPSVSLSSLLPDLAEETYRHGMSALSDVLELLEFADGPQHRRLEGELAEIDDRLQRDSYTDERARSRDEQRQATHRQLLARHDESRQRAHDLIFEAERCTAALAEARIELASVRAGDTQVDVDAVVETLESSIRRVRDVQDELRRLGY
jgi:hypothetical protein